MAQLKATIRTETGKSRIRKLRRAGILPAVMYGHGDPSVMLSIPAHDFMMLLRELKSKAPIVDLAIDSVGTTRCVIKTIQRNPIDGSFLHVDFQKVHAGEKITLNVPVIIHGTPEGVKQGGMLEQLLREIPVRAEINKIPEHIDIDITHLKMGHSIHISDLKVPEVELMLPPESAIVTILTPRKLAAAEVATPQPEAAPAEPEVIKEKKKEEAVTEEEKPETETKKKEEKKK
jgi:large subunit ribosomal protein L25|uniref:Large ribosomal subunit protein bL25 n=1 Tax=candidate division WOR-3 bacterium TaxID=2052148 RepID=A0A7V3PUV2_UNCW3